MYSAKIKYVLVSRMLLLCLNFLVPLRCAVERNAILPVYTIDLINHQIYHVQKASVVNRCISFKTPFFFFFCFCFFFFVDKLNVTSRENLSSWSPTVRLKPACSATEAS